MKIFNRSIISSYNHSISIASVHNHVATAIIHSLSKYDKFILKGNHCMNSTRQLLLCVLLKYFNILRTYRLMYIPHRKITCNLWQE